MACSSSARRVAWGRPSGADFRRTLPSRTVARAVRLRSSIHVGPSYREGSPPTTWRDERRVDTGRPWLVDACRVLARSKGRTARMPRSKGTCRRTALLDPCRRSRAARAAPSSYLRPLTRTVILIISRSWRRGLPTRISVAHVLERPRRAYRQRVRQRETATTHSVSSAASARVSSWSRCSRRASRDCRGK